MYDFGLSKINKNVLFVLITKTNIVWFHIKMNYFEKMKDF
jgi:hypothetical protein